MINLELNQIVDPAIECWVRDESKDKWLKTDLFTIDHRNMYPFMTQESTQGYKYCTLEDPYKPKEPEYVPFDFNDELVGKVIRLKGSETSKSIIIEQGSVALRVSVYTVTYEALLNSYTFLDGSPCGKLKED